MGQGAPALAPSREAAVRSMAKVTSSSRRACTGTRLGSCRASSGRRSAACRGGIAAEIEVDDAKCRSSMVCVWGSQFKAGGVETPPAFVSCATPRSVGLSVPGETACPRGDSRMCEIESSRTSEPHRTVSLECRRERPEVNAIPDTSAPSVPRPGQGETLRAPSQARWLNPCEYGGSGCSSPPLEVDDA